MHKGSEVWVRDITKILHVAVFFDVFDDLSIAELAQSSQERDGDQGAYATTGTTGFEVVEWHETLNDGLPGDELAQDDQVMSRVAQMGVDPLRRKHLVKCLCYHGRDLCWGCRSTSMSTLSYPLEVKEKYPLREVQQILLTQARSF